MPSLIALVSYGGTDLNAPPFKPPFRHETIRGGGIGESYQMQIVETEVPGRFANFVRGQPKSKDFTVNFYSDESPELFVGDKFDMEAMFFNVFDPGKGEQALVAYDGKTFLTMDVLPTKITVEQSGHYIVNFHASEPVWHSVDPESVAVHNIATSGNSFTLNHTGNTRTYPSFTLQPNALKSNSVSWTKRRRVVLANASEFPLNDFVNRDGYPIELNQGTFSFPIGNDVRVILNNREQNRWVSSASLWCNMEMRSKLTATLAAHIDSNVTALTVSNTTLFEGWDEAGGFFLIDNEVIQYASLVGNAALGLRRGAMNTTPAGHNTNATVLWVQHPFLDFIYDFPSAGSPPSPPSSQPVIHLATSTNIYHWWYSRFFTNGDVSSRTWERVYDDDGITSQRLRQYNGPLSTLRFEDLTPQANKPPYNSVRMQFPVPLRGSPGSLQITEKIDATLELSGFVVDLDGNETRLFFGFNTAGGTANHSYSPADACSSVRLNARIGAVIGDLDVSLAAGPIAYFTSASSLVTSTVDNPLGHISSPPPGAVALPLVVTTPKYPAIHFSLDQETSIDGFVAYLKAGSGSLGYAIYTDESDRPGKAVAYGTFPSPGGSNKLVSSTFTVPIDLPSGGYWCVIITGSGFLGSHSSRTSATVYYGQHRLPDLGHPVSITFTNGTQTDEVPWPDTDNMHFNQYSISPIFGVLSKTTNAQANSPSQTGNVIDLSNIKANLDSSRAPVVKVQAEEDVYVMDAVLKNETTGDSLAIFALIASGQNVAIDCDNRKVIDSETGLEVPSVVTPSNPDDWMFLVPGNNVISYTEVGVTDVDITPSWLRAVN